MSRLITVRSQCCLSDAISRVLKHCPRVETPRTCLKTPDLDQKRKFGLRKDVLLCDALGRNSRKSAYWIISVVAKLLINNWHTPSTGKLPPTPNPSAAYSPQVPTQLGPPPTARPNTPARNRVVLNARRRPARSDPMPQNEAPVNTFGVSISSSRRLVDL